MLEFVWNHTSSQIGNFNMKSSLGEGILFEGC